MKTQTQIVALCHNGALLLWHETQNDFVAYELEVPNTDASELVYALFKAKEYSGIQKVWMEVIDLQTGQLIN